MGQLDHQLIVLGLRGPRRLDALQSTPELSCFDSWIHRLRGAKGVKVYELVKLRLDSPDVLES